MLGMQCFNCGHAVVLQTAQKVQFRDTCPNCDTDLRVCRNCRHFDPKSHNECREVMAEWVRFKDRANYCDYFSPTETSAATPAAKSGGGGARSAFDRLFKD